MKKFVCIVLAMVLVMAFSSQAFAYTVGYVNYVLRNENGKAIKLDSESTEKTNDLRYAENELRYLSRDLESGKPVTVRAKKASNAASASEAKDHYGLGIKS